jgi:hypothetical protein
MVCRCVLALMAIFLLGALSASSQPASSHDFGMSSNVSANVAINDVDNDTVDFGFCNYGIIGDLVWNDSNGNGIYDMGESVLREVSVTLYYEQSGTPMRKTLTNESGNYTFEVCYGKYKVIVAEENYIPGKFDPYSGGPYIKFPQFGNFWWYTTTHNEYVISIDKNNSYNTSIDFGLRLAE